MTTCSPVTIAGSSASRWAALPSAAMAAAATFSGMNGPGWTKRPSCSAMIAASSRPAPLTLPPPSASGTIMANQPSSADFRSQDRSYPSGSSCSSLVPATGSSASMNETAVSLNRVCSSVRSGCIGIELPPDDWL